MLLFLAACTAGKPPADTADTVDTAETAETGDTAAADGWCAVLTTFDRSCVSCHSAAGASGGLDLETDPWAALVNVPSAAYEGRTLVVPGDPDASFLVAKLAGVQGADGGPMPPGESLDAALQAEVSAWIAKGATQECANPDTGVKTERHHPEGWADPNQHGLPAKLQEEECADCHGADLAGGTVGVSCDTCHTYGWRTECTRCHGGGETTGGAPPVDIDDAATGISFPEHTVHVTETIHTAWDCVQCHTKPSDVLTPGHIFIDDATAAAAEVVFGGGQSPTGTFSAGTCSNVYCHGNGRAGSTGTVSTGAEGSCELCHGDRSSAGRLSGEHGDHVEGGVQCGECHGEVVSGWDTVVGPTLHVNTTVNLALPDGIGRSGDECTGACHGEQHDGRDWD